MHPWVTLRGWCIFWWQDMQRMSHLASSFFIRSEDQLQKLWDIFSLGFRWCKFKFSVDPQSSHFFSIRKQSLRCCIHDLWYSLCLFWSLYGMIILSGPIIKVLACPQRPVRSARGVAGYSGFGEFIPLMRRNDVWAGLSCHWGRWNYPPPFVRCLSAPQRPVRVGRGSPCAR